VARLVGEALRLALERAGLTQADLARASKIAQAQISQIERGRRLDPQFSTIARLAFVLGISLDDLAADVGLRSSQRGGAQDFSQSDLARLLERLNLAASSEEQLKKAIEDSIGLARALEKRAHRRR